MSDQNDNQNAFCFCELAPLYALDILSEAERDWVEAQLQDCPELAEELVEYEETVAELSYDTSPVPLAPCLKEKLFLRLEEDVSPELSPVDPPQPQPATAAAAAIMSIRVAEAIWRPYTIPGIQIAMLHLVSSKRQLSCLMKAERGARYPSHRHGGDEEILMISGDLIIANEVYGPGDYIYSESDSIHPSADTPNGCMFFLRTSLDNEWLDLDLRNGWENA